MSVLHPELLVYSRLILPFALGLVLVPLHKARMLFLVVCVLWFGVGLHYFFRHELSLSRQHAILSHELCHLHYFHQLVTHVRLFVNAR